MDVHGGGAARSAGQGGHITIRNGVLEAVQLMVEQSRGVSVARLREIMAGIAELCRIGLSGELKSFFRQMCCHAYKKLQCMYVPGVAFDM